MQEGMEKGTFLIVLAYCVMQEHMENGTFWIVISLLSHARRYGKRYVLDCD
jgi:hypothetical protein